MAAGERRTFGALTPKMTTMRRLMNPTKSGVARALELTILMPCLNEAETVATCTNKARSFLDRTGIEGEIVVADNGSSDGSPELARMAGARVVHIAEKGYGNAL